MSALERWQTSAVEEFVIGCVLALVGVVLLPEPVTYILLVAAGLVWLRGIVKLIRR